ncbi:MAG: hypothetical protein ACI936_001516 [Paraglaciecola sp.]|jgi:hypothetical protein
MKAWKLSPLVAVIVSVNALAIESTGISLGGGLNFAPLVVLSTENNDNIYSEQTNEQSSTINRLAPSLSLSGDYGKTIFNTNYQAEMGTYSRNSDDDYLDQIVSGYVSYELSARHQIDVDASYLDAHDARGSVAGAESDNSADPDEYNQTEASLTYIFGSDTAMANIDVYVDTFQKRYDNNETLTSIREYEKNTFGALFSIKASSATQILFEARQSQLTYQDDSVDNDSSIQHLLTGMRWDMTGATTGEVKIGRVVRNFDASNKSSGVHLNWSANLTWQPLTYSSVLVTTGQSTDESNGTGNYIASSASNVYWNHEFSNFISVGISANYGEDEYVKNIRNDINRGFGINATYSPLIWMDVDLSASQSLRKSNITGLDKETNLIRLGVTLAL